MTDAKPPLPGFQQPLDDQLSKSVEFNIIFSTTNCCWTFPWAPVGWRSVDIPVWTSGTRTHSPKQEPGKLEYFCLFCGNTASDSKMAKKFVAKPLKTGAISGEIHLIFKALLFYTGTNARSSGNIPKVHEAFQRVWNHFRMIYMFGKRPGSQAPSAFDLDTAPALIYSLIYNVCFLHNFKLE